VCFPEVQKILSIGVSSQVLAEKNGNYCLPSIPGAGLTLKRDVNSPFIVVEGLDGCGKRELI
jgi:hypothetical protein